jgi:nucleotide-binding universal stress UspA family protein
MARILLAFDGSDGALGAVTALSHWNLAGSVVTLLTVLDREEWPNQQVSRLRETAANSLRRLGARVEPVIAAGGAAEQILMRALRGRTDLIVLGPRKRPALSQLLLGSVTGAVLRHAPCPVLVGRLSLATERLLLVVDDAADMAAIVRAWPTLPLPSQLEITLAGLPRPIPSAEVPTALRHQAPRALPQVSASAEAQRVQSLLDSGEAFFRREGVRVVSVLLPAKEDAISEVLAIEARLAPELIVLHHPSGDDERQLVARARSSVLLLP